MTETRPGIPNQLDELLVVTVGVRLAAWRTNDEEDSPCEEGIEFNLGVGIDDCEETALTLQEIATEAEASRLYGWMRQKILENEIAAGEVRAMSIDELQQAHIASGAAPALDGRDKTETPGRPAGLPEDKISKEAEFAYLSPIQRYWFLTEEATVPHWKRRLLHEWLRATFLRSPEGKPSEDAAFRLGVPPRLYREWRCRHAL